VHLLQRGLYSALARHGAGALVLRYRIEFRLKCVDRFYPPAWGVTHASDMPLWFWGNGAAVLERREKPVVRNAFLQPLAQFVTGDAPKNIDWGTTGVRQARLLRPDGTVAVWDDDRWDEGQRVWAALREASPRTAKL
jgi:carboxylesterase type B